MESKFRLSPMMESYASQRLEDRNRDKTKKKNVNNNNSNEECRCKELSHYWITNHYTHMPYTNRASENSTFP